jgi:hypothetical protein
VLTRLVALLLALFAVILCPMAVWASAGISTMLAPETYKKGLASQNIYSEFVPAVLSDLVNDRATADSDAPIRQLTAIVTALDPDELRAVANELIPPEWLRTQTEQGIDAIFAWINGDSDTLSQDLDLSEVRNRLAGEEGRSVAAQVIEDATACTAEQITQVSASDQEVMPVCQPPPELVPPMTERLARFFAEISRSLERDQIPLAELLDVPRRSGLRLEVAIVQESIGLLYLLPAAFLAMLVIVRVRSLHGFSRWMSATGILCGLVALVPLLLGPLATLDSLLSLSSAQRGVLETSLWVGMYVSVLTQFGGPVLFQAVLLLAVGFVLFAFTIIVPQPVTDSGAVRRTVKVPTHSTH